jgi:uncharacterized membrane protein
MKHPERESHLRSVIKGITWRFIATATTMTIAFIITGEVTQALQIGSIEFLGKLLIYYLHERAWQLIPRGAVRHWFDRKK